MKTKVLSVFSLLIIAVAAAVQAETADPASLPAVSARVVSVSNDTARVFRESEQRPVSRGLALYESDRIVSNDATVGVVFANGSTLTINPGTDISFLSLRQAPYDPAKGSYGSLKEDPSQSITLTRLNRGEVIGQTKSLSTNSRFEIQTTVGVAGVRGSIVHVSLKPDPQNPNHWIFQATNVAGDIYVVLINFVDGVAFTQDEEVLEVGETAESDAIFSPETGDVIHVVGADNIPLARRRANIGLVQAVLNLANATLQSADTGDQDESQDSSGTPQSQQQQRDILDALEELDQFEQNLNEDNPDPDTEKTDAEEDDDIDIPDGENPSVSATQTF